jgi:hypothetical protein
MDIEAWSGPFERAIELEDELAWHGIGGIPLYYIFRRVFILSFSTLPKYPSHCPLLQAVS